MSKIQNEETGTDVNRIKTEMEVTGGSGARGKTLAQ